MFVKLMAMTDAFMTKILKDVKGATAIEYGLIVAAISLAIVTAVFLFGADLQALFSLIADKMASARTKAGA